MCATPLSERIDLRADLEVGATHTHTETTMRQIDNNQARTARPAVTP